MACATGVTISPNEGNVFVNTVKFCGKYVCDTPSVAEAMEKTEMICEDISGSVDDGWRIRTYPKGRVNCGKCRKWKDFNLAHPMWSVRDCFGELKFESLVCDECSKSDCFEGFRLSQFMHTDYPNKY